MADKNDRVIYISSSSETSDSPIYISSSSSEDEHEETTTYYKVQLKVPAYKPTNKSSTRQQAEAIFHSWKGSHLTIEEMEEIIEDYKSCHPDE